MIRTLKMHVTHYYLCPIEKKFQIDHRFCSDYPIEKRIPIRRQISDYQMHINGKLIKIFVEMINMLLKDQECTTIKFDRKI